MNFSIDVYCICTVGHVIIESLSFKPYSYANMRYICTEISIIT